MEELYIELREIKEKLQEIEKEVKEHLLEKGILTEWDKEKIRLELMKQNDPKKYELYIERRRQSRRKYKLKMKEKKSVKNINDEIKNN